MKIGVWSGLVLTLFVSHIVRADPEPKKFTTVGSFSSMEFTEAHQYGSEVQLWKEGSNLLGLFSYSEVSSEILRPVCLRIRSMIRGQGRSRSRLSSRQVNIFVRFTTTYPLTIYSVSEESFPIPQFPAY